MGSNESPSGVDLLAAPYTLPCGVVVPNRLCKAPMEEMMGKFSSGRPTSNLFNLYSRWAQGGWGMVITGNVALDQHHLGTPFDISLPDPPHTSPDPLATFKAYADAAKGQNLQSPLTTGPVVIVQLCHAGRQSMRASGRRPWEPSIAPSAVRVRSLEALGVAGNAIDWALWGTPAEMSISQIKDVVDRFADAAVLCEKAGFDGVELHASHGYLLSAFLSPKTNLRQDQYGGSAENRVRILMEALAEVRRKTSPGFAVGVKLNSSDFVTGGLSEADALLNARWLAESKQCDFIEISGGNYENPSFVTKGFSADQADALNAQLSGKKADIKPVSERTKRREGFFISFAQRCRASLPSDSRMALILTGGLRSREGIAAVLRTGAIDMAGIARPAALYPDLPLRLMDNSIPDGDARAAAPDYNIRDSWLSSLANLKLIGAGWQTIWHVGQMSLLARDKSANPDIGPMHMLASIFTPWIFHPWVQLLISLSIAGFGLFIATVIGLYNVVDELVP